MSGFATAQSRKSRQELCTAGQGPISETFSRSITSLAAVASTQQIFANSLGLRAGDVVTNVHCSVEVAAAGAAPTLVKMALLDSTGKVLQQSANLAGDVMWQTAAPRTVPLAAAITIPTDGLYYVALLKNGVFGGTEPQFLKTTPNSSTSLAAIGAGAIVMGRQVGQTDFAANGASQVLTAVSTAAYWFAVS